MPNNEKGIDRNDAVSEQEPTQQRSIVLSVVAIIWGGSCVGSQDFPTVLKAYFEPSTGIANLATGIVLGFSLALSILYVRGLIHRGQASIDARYDIEMFWTAGPLKAGFQVVILGFFLVSSFEPLGLCILIGIEGPIYCVIFDLLFVTLVFGIFYCVEEWDLKTRIQKCQRADNRSL